jgi:hypothetical protein
VAQRANAAASILGVTSARIAWYDGANASPTYVFLCGRIEPPYFITLSTTSRLRASANRGLVAFRASNSLTAEHAADLLWALGSAELEWLLVVERGWPPEQYQQWLAVAWVHALPEPCDMQ